MACPARARRSGNSGKRDRSAGRPDAIPRRAFPLQNEDARARQGQRSGQSGGGQPAADGDQVGSITRRSWHAAEPLAKSNRSGPDEGNSLAPGTPARLPGASGHAREGAMTQRVVIVGAGQAGAQVGISLRQSGFAGEILLLGDEPVPPYQRPPLSKAYMSGEMALERTLIRSEAYYVKSAIELRLGVSVGRLLRDERAVVLNGEKLAYDVLVLCTGTRARRLGLSGEALDGVFYLRTLADSERIRAAVRPGARAVIIGGGYIGLEIAASLRKLGAEATVLEALDRVMNRVVAPPVSAFFAAEHARHGVAIETGAKVAALEGAGAVEQVICRDGRAFAADLVVIGVGAVPNDELARAAGLEVENGIIVDEFGRASDSSIFAAGDVTNHPSPLFDRRLRLESVHNAMAQAKAVAQAITGKPMPYAEVPWFWSDQYDLKLQIAGVGAPGDELILRGEPASRSFSALHLQDRRLVAIDCVNRGADFLAAKKLIADRRPIDRARAADPEVRLAEL
jgi:3-phenylpropionate/trans-cinnamate dioxygenase ferredoxin reductase subunit